MGNKDRAHNYYVQLLEARESLQPIADSLEEEGAAINRDMKRNGISLSSRGILAALADLSKRHLKVRNRIIDYNSAIAELEDKYGFANWRVPNSRFDPPVLKGVTLAAIVRDEVRNPAGGIVGWINSSVPYVEKAVIVDTGSSDKTMAVLKCALGVFDNLEVYGINWQGFSQARNYAMSKVRTDRALILDADEVIADEFLSPTRGFEHLKREFAQHPKRTRFEIPVQPLYADTTESPETNEAINPRIILAEDWFEVKQKERDCYEHVNSENDSGLRINSPVAIYHFLPGFIPTKLKREFYYEDGSFMIDTPLQSANTLGWKEANPKRHVFRN